MGINSKALISSILSSTLILSNLATPAFATGASKVTLNIEPPTPEVIAVKVPTEIPITLKNNGDVEVPQDLKITNLSSTTAVKAESIQVEGLNGWSVKDYSTDFTSKPENTQELGLQLRGDNSDDSGNINLTPNNWVIAEDSTLTLNAKAKIPTQNREQSDVGEIAQVNYTFAIADASEESHSITNDWDKPKVIKDSVTPVTFDIYSTSPDTHIVSVQSDNEAVTLEKAANTFSTNAVGSEVWNVRASKLGIANVTATLNTGETTTFTVNVYELNIPDGGDSGITVDVPDKNPGDNIETGDITVDVPIKNPDGSDGTITVTPEIPEGTPPLVKGENNINVNINIDVNINININITINVNGGGQEPSEQFTVTYITDGNGTVSEDNRKFNSGANLTFPTATPNEGYTFDKWVDTTTGLEVTGDTIVTSNMEVKATFKVIPLEQFTVTYITGGNGTVSEDSRVFEEGSELTFPSTTPSEGYVFDKWVDNSTGLEVTGSTIVNGDMEVKAIFKVEPVEQFTVTYITDGNGTVNENSRIFEKGSNLTFPDTTPSDGFTFDKWINNDSGVTVTEDTVVNSNITVKATFKSDESALLDYYTFKASSTGWTAGLNSEFKAALNQQNPSAYKDWNPGDPLPELPSTYQGKPVTSMSYMFMNCGDITSLDLSKFDVSNVKYMAGMFQSCTSLTSINLRSFYTSNVTDMDSMFQNCSSLTSLDVSKFNTTKVKGMDHMFAGCSALTSLDLYSFYTGRVERMDFMFSNCKSLRTCYAATQADCNRFNDSLGKPVNVTFFTKY